MIPISDDNPTLRTPVMTYLLLGIIGFVWVFVQRAGLDAAGAHVAVDPASAVPTGLPQLSPIRPDASGGVAVWAHIGGFVAGMVLIKLFENRNYTAQRTGWRHRLHPDHP